MKKIEAVIRKERFPAVDVSLKRIGIGGLTVYDVRGRGRSKGSTMVVARGTGMYQEEYLERIKLEIIVKDRDVEKVVESIISNATTDSVGDGKIFVSPIDRVIDIGSNAEDETAI
ncbi:MAG: P-II family nitrogen regulator [Nitrososphaerota archaeon]|nr:P-II family nitrogen regulator [Nitrososphaerota archaeon]MDG6938835.1 P-II family nitrogen regulator [Nitrososphaerota archaeon]